MRVALTVAVTLALLAGCGGLPPMNASTCADVPTAHTRGQPGSSLVNCAGVLGFPAGGGPSLTVPAGSSIQVDGLQSPGCWNPHSSDPGVLAVSHYSGRTAELRAVAPGSAVLSLKTLYCMAPLRDGRCPALVVYVR